MQPLKHILFLLFIFLLSASYAQKIHERPLNDSLVNDFAGVLTKSQKNTLEYKLRYFHDTTSNQIVVVTLNSLDGYDPASYAFALGEQWGIGQKDFNNGIVILLKPKFSSTDKGQIFIATGYGLEPVIPDATGKRIVEKEMVPNFKNGDYYQGIDQAVDVLMKLASGEISAKGYNKASQTPWFVGILPFLIIIIIFFFISRSQKNSYGIGSRNGSLWTALFLGSMLGNRSHGGSWNNFSGGSSGFGGGSGGSGFGGGFSGFGGGSFGGGGAGGSW
ncbi:MAG: hypothetical protein COW63_00385 [Bacteroidetes bacterium CG18_big_fil_WC_8_21_14_2_50_41_14]|nr:MAG: hypothetical protein COW63_00385 [Bacteroidetes bacterium CG18_big_fil_WC_8_21_14_2_50_41_14]PJB56687.1 MAG: hypothetical protein CO098_13450 [Bacteroidetes bacterium CG_4_9_14_3_um_filter_41_19]